MKECYECKKVKFEWQFFTIIYCSWLGYGRIIKERSNICKKCAEIISDDAGEKAIENRLDEIKREEDQIKTNAYQNIKSRLGCIPNDIRQSEEKILNSIKKSCFKKKAIKK